MVKKMGINDRPGQNKCGLNLQKIRTELKGTDPDGLPYQEPAQAEDQAEPPLLH